MYNQQFSAYITSFSISFDILPKQIEQVKKQHFRVLKIQKLFEDQFLYKLKRQESDEIRK